jgi:hypothetical protein
VDQAGGTVLAGKLGVCYSGKAECMLISLNTSAGTDDVVCNVPGSNGTLEYHR